MLIAVPSDAPGGIDAKISAHFGHCAVFTLVEVKDGQVGQVTTLENQKHGGQCMGPVNLLHEQGAQTLLAGGIGMRPLAGFRQVGIHVHAAGEAKTVKEAVQAFIAGECPEFDDKHSCGEHGGCGGHGHHDDGPKLSDYKPVDVPVGMNHMVRLSYELYDDEGTLIDRAPEVRYVQGMDMIVGGLEQAVAGRRAGESFEIKLAPAEAFGERDESRGIDVPANLLPKEAKPGVLIPLQAPDGRVVPATLLSVDDERAQLDTNHPLAGKTVVFKVKVLEVLEHRDNAPS